MLQTYSLYGGQLLVLSDAHTADLSAYMLDSCLSELTLTVDLIAITFDLALFLADDVHV